MKRHPRGFTLIELMITVAVVAILTALALPSYREYLRKSRRAEAQAFLLAVAAREQQFLVDTRAYASLTTVNLAMPSNVAAAYDIAVVPSDGPPPTFTITATPKSDQASEPCGTLGIDQTGAKTATGSGCW